MNVKHEGTTHLLKEIIKRSLRRLVTPDIDFEEDIAFFNILEEQQDFQKGLC